MLFEFWSNSLPATSRSRESGFKSPKSQTQLTIYQAKKQNRLNPMAGIVAHRSRNSSRVCRLGVLRFRFRVAADRGGCSEYSSGWKGCRGWSASAAQKLSEKAQTISRADRSRRSARNVRHGEDATPNRNDCALRRSGAPPLLFLRKAIPEKNAPKLFRFYRLQESEGG